MDHRGRIVSTGGRWVTLRDDSWGYHKSETNTSPTTGDEETKGTVIVFTDDGFDPLKYVSKEGEAVTVRNDSSMDLQFSSADHPTHLEHPEFNMEVLSPGESGTFTPESIGTFEFHDHLNSQFTGTLTVE
jgi:hypothetical protein